MYLQETDFNPEKHPFHGRPQKPLLLLQEFLRRKKPVMEVCFTRFEYKDAASCRSTFAKAIGYYELDQQVAVRSSGRKVYLIRLNPQQYEPCSIYRIRARAISKLIRLRSGAGA